MGSVNSVRQAWSWLTENQRHLGSQEDGNANIDPEEFRLLRNFARDNLSGSTNPEHAQILSGLNYINDQSFTAGTDDYRLDGGDISIFVRNLGG